ncbi:MAG: hypothetical protein ACI9GB_003798 [Halioglobus sp.]
MPNVSNASSRMISSSSTIRILIDIALLLLISNTNLPSAV